MNCTYFSKIKITFVNILLAGTQNHCNWVFSLIFVYRLNLFIFLKKYVKTLHNVVLNAFLRIDTITNLIDSIFMYNNKKSLKHLLMN